MIKRRGRESIKPEVEVDGWVVSWGGSIVLFFGKKSEERARDFADRNLGAGANVRPLDESEVYHPCQLCLPGMRNIVVWIEEELEHLQKGMSLFLERCRQSHEKRVQLSLMFID